MVLAGLGAGLDAWRAAKGPRQRQHPARRLVRGLREPTFLAQPLVRRQPVGGLLHPRLEAVLPDHDDTSRRSSSPRRSPAHVSAPPHSFSTSAPSTTRYPSGVMATTDRPSAGSDPQRSSASW